MVFTCITNDFAPLRARSAARRSANKAAGAQCLAPAGRANPFPATTGGLTFGVQSILWGHQVDTRDEESPRRSEGDLGPLPLKKALRAWSDPEALRHLDEMSRFEKRPVVVVVHLGTQTPDPYTQGHWEWRRRFAPLQEAFLARLRGGVLIATGFAQPLTPSSQRSRIDPALFELLELDYGRAEAKHGGLTFTRVVRPPWRQLAPTRRL